MVVSARLAGVVASLITSFALAQVATVPETLMGTYTLTLAERSGTVFDVGAVKTFVVGPDNTLCVDGLTLSNPVITLGDNSRAVWISGGRQYKLQNISTGVFKEFLISSDPLGSYYGRWSGTRTSTVTTGCGTATPSLTTEAQSMFDLAAELYPTLFRTGTEARNYQGYTYRFYPESGIYVGIKDNKVYLLGGQFGSAISEQGNVAAVVTSLQNVKKARATPAPTPTPTPTPTPPTTATVNTEGLDSSGLANLAGQSGITLTANGVVRNYLVGGTTLQSSTTGFLVSFQNEASASRLNANVYVPNKVGVYACGTGTSAATSNGYFTTNQTAWLGFDGTGFGGTPISTLGGSCTVEVLSVSPKLEGRFIAQLVGAAAGNGKVTSGYFSVPNVVVINTATVGTGTGSLVVTARNTTVPSKHTGTMQITGAGLTLENGACVVTGRGAYTGSSEIYTIKISRGVGAGQVGGWEFGNADLSFFAGASNVTTKSIEMNKTTRTVRVSDTFGTTGGSSSVKVEGSFTWTDVGNVTGCI